MSEPVQPDRRLDNDAGPLEEPAGDWFVSRQRQLDIFWKWANNIPSAGRNSLALIGLRRTGKTAILHKTFNRLFHEQSQVLPVYITFAQYLHRPESINSYEFVETFIGGYVRSYLAFRYGLPHLLKEKEELAYLEELANQYQDEMLLYLFKRYRLPDVDALSEIVLFELTHHESALWEHYENEYGKYVRQLNGDQPTRKILCWIANHPGAIIRPDTVAEVFGLSWEGVQEALEKLYRLDVIQRASVMTYEGPNHPLVCQ